MIPKSLLQVKYFGIVFFVYLIVLGIQYFGSNIYIFILSIPLILGLFWNFKKGIITLLLIIFLFDDLPFNLKDPIFYSIHRASIGGQTITKIISLFLIVFLIYAYIKKKHLPKIHPLIYVLSGLFLIGIITGFVRGNFIYFTEFVNDLRFYLNFFIGFFIALVLFTGPFNKIHFLELISLIFIAKAFAIIIFNLFVFKNNISSDTTFYFCNVIFLFLLHQLEKENGSKSLIYFGLTVLLLSLALSVSRGKIVLFGISLSIYMIIARKLKYMPPIALGIIIMGIAIYFVSPKSFEYLVWKLTSFLPNENGGKSAYVRYIEIQSILYDNFSSIDNFLFGRGFGGYFTTEQYNFPFEIEGTSSYPTEHIKIDKFFKPHGSLLVVLLKNGIGGIIMLYSTLIGIVISSSVKFGRKYNLILVFASCLIPIFLISYSAKQNLFGGLFFGIFSCLLNESGNKIGEVKK